MGEHHGRVTAVVFVFLMVSSVALTPIAQGLESDDGALQVGNVAIDESLPPQEQKLLALEEAGYLQSQEAQQREGADRSVDKLRASTLDAYRGDTRVRDQHVFINDSQAIRALSSYSRSDSPREALRITNRIAIADNESAWRSLEDARVALERYEGQLSHGQTAGAEAHIRSAERAFERAQDSLENAEDAGIDSERGIRDRINHRADAVTHLRQTWHQAQLALERIDSGVEPRIEMGTTVDPVWEDGQPDVYYVTGRYDDIVRHDESPNLTVTIDDRTHTISPSDDVHSPVANRSFGLQVNRTQRVTEITVSATGADGNHASDDDWRRGPPGHARAGGRSRWGDDHRRGPPGYGHRHRLPNPHDRNRWHNPWDRGRRGWDRGRDRAHDRRGRFGDRRGGPGWDDEDHRGGRWDHGNRDHDDDSSTATLLLDGDGLPAWYEREIGSDPLDPDGDVADLAGYQGDDVVHDGAHVARNDALADDLSNESVLRPTPDFSGNDTDGDGIPDDRERQLGLNATNNNTDGDGISDRYETIGGAAVDWDGDGTIDALDQDNDGDSVFDTDRGREDIDENLLPNYRDRDDDGDGIPTQIEFDNSSAYSSDMDLDGIDNWFDPDADDDGIGDGEEGIIDEDGDGIPAYLDNDQDNDGLPDFYERNVTRTDPADNDSDSGHTSGHEASDGINDGEEDFDGDGLPTHVEYRFGLDPFAEDTDGDGLNDSFELRQPSLNASNPDTDGDGVLDGDEDPDTDTLANAQEANLGTAIGAADTDGDGLADADEIDNGTDPLVPDTDEDGLVDSEELSLPTDPLDPDTDDNGVLDGEETFTTTAENETFGVSVSLTGQGNVAGGVTIQNGTNRRFASPAVEDARVASLVDLESEQSFESANVTFEYDTSAVNDSEDIVVARYNRTTQTFDLLDSRTDRVNGTITAETRHFSRFTVFHVPNWNESLSAEVPEGNETSNPEATTTLDVLFLMDTSGSMNGNDPNEFAKEAGQRFTGGLLDRDRAAVFEFAHEGTLLQPLTTDHAAVNATIANLNYRGGRGGTRLGPSLEDANDYLIANGNDSHSQVILFLTDGKGPGGISEARDAANHSITVHTVGFGGANEGKLADIANITGGSFHGVESASDLPDVFSRIAENTTIQGVDSDDDGLPDHVERGFTTGLGRELHTDPHDPDTDGDGLLDGEEVGERIEGSQQVVIDGVMRTVQHTYWRLNSDPTAEDTDGDGLSDGIEQNETTIQLIDSQESAIELARELNSPNAENVTVAEYATTMTVTSDPMKADTDGDGIDDEQEWIWGSHPRRADSDNDGMTDYEEQAADSEEDPTMFDIRGPEIEVIGPYTGWHSPQWTVDNIYQFTFIVTDPSDVSNVSISRMGGTVHFTDQVDTRQKFYSTTIRTGFIPSAGDNLGGTSFYIRANDTHGNERRVLALSRSNAIIALLEDSGIVDEMGGGAAHVYGWTSGFLYGFGEMGHGIVSLGEAAMDPVATLQTIADEAPYVFTHLGEVVSQLQQRFDHRQKLNNPFPAHSPENESFESGFNRGYALFFVTEIFAGIGVAQELSNSERVARAGRLLEDTAYVSRVYRGAQWLNDVRKIPSRAAARAVSSGIDAATSPIRTVLRESGTMSRLARAQQRIARAAPDALGGVRDRYYQFVARNFYRADLGDLNEAQLTRAGRLLHADQQRAARLLRRMDDADQRAFLDPNLADDVHDSLYDAWRRSPDVDASDVGQATRHYSGLGQLNSQRFRSILDDPDLRSSWVRVVGDSGVDRAKVRYTLSQVDEIDEFGEVIDFQLGRAVQRQEYPPDWDNVYPERSIVTEFELTENTRFYRLYTEGDNPMASRFLLRNEDDIRNLSPQELQGRYAIPSEPPDSVAVADVDAGTTMRTGRVAENDFGDGGRTQYTIPESQVPDLPEDWFEKSSELTNELVD